MKKRGIYKTNRKSLPLRHENDVAVDNHYETTPIQIYWEFYHQKMKIFRWKTLIFFLFLLKT